MGPGGISILPFLVSSLVLPFVFAFMARNRSLSVPGWAVLGFIPVLNVVGFVILLCIRPKSHASLGQTQE